MRSDNVKKGPERAPNRSLFYALGYTPEELERPLIGVVSAHSEIVPGHMNLDKVADAVKAGIQMAGGAETKTAKLLEDVTNCIMKTFKIITYYAPIGFFGFFAYLIAYHGSDLIGDYGRALAIYYILSFVYMLVFSPIYARFGGGRGAAKVMFSKLFRPAAVSFGTCSSVATIPTNMEVAEESGISKDVTDIVLPLGATMHMDGSVFSAILKISFLFGFFASGVSRVAFLPQELSRTKEQASTHLPAHHVRPLVAQDRQVAV